MRQLRLDFPILSRATSGTSLVYLDNAATTHKPHQVIEVIRTFYAERNATVGRGLYGLAEQATADYEAVRAQVAAFIGAAPEEIIFTAGATASINLFASSWALHNCTSGDEIVLTELEHHTNLIPWQEVAKKTGAIIRFIPVDDEGLLRMDLVPSLITEKTKLVAAAHVSNALGTHVDVAALARAAHAVGAIMVVDGAQSVPHQKVDVTQLGCDVLVFSAHKMMGPTGLGVLYVNKRLHKQMQPSQFGGGMVFDADFGTATYAQPPHCFEAGTPPVAQIIGFGAALTYLEKNNILKLLPSHESELCARLIDGLSMIEGIRILGPRMQLKQQGHLVSFVVDGVHAHDVAAYLDSQGIAVRAGHHCAQPLAKKLGITASVRASFYVYNTLEEVDALIVALEALKALK